MNIFLIIIIAFLLGVIITLLLLWLFIKWLLSDVQLIKWVSKFMGLKITLLPKHPFGTTLDVLLEIDLRVAKSIINHK